MDAVTARARACLGLPFRPHGRLPGDALDCVGVAAHAFGIVAPAGYALRGGTVGEVEAAIAALGFARADGGRLLLLAAAPRQHHLAVAVPGGFVHACASLRRVVEVPGRPRWPLVSAWTREV